MTLESVRRHGLEAVLYSDARVEPTDASLDQAIRFAAEGRFDGFVAVGGGSAWTPRRPPTSTPRGRRTS